MSTLEIHGGRTPDGRPAGKPHGGRMQPTGAELGTQIRTALWQFAAGTRTQGTARDRAGVAMVRSQYPASRGVFSDAALAAVLRPPPQDRCAWDAYRELAASSGEPAPVPSPDLFGLLGRQCGNCQTDFAAQVVADRERAHVASLTAAGIRPELSGVLRSPAQVARYQRGAPPSYYQPSRRR